MLPVVHDPAVDVSTVQPRVRVAALLGGQEPDRGRIRVAIERPPGPAAWSGCSPGDTVRDLGTAGADRRAGPLLGSRAGDRGADVHPLGPRRLGGRQAARRHPHQHRARMDLDLQRCRCLARATVELVRGRFVQYHLDLLASRGVHERRALRLAGHDAAYRPDPLQAAPRGHDAHVEQAIVRLGSIEQVDTAQHLAHVPGQHAGDRASVEALAVDLHRCPHRAGSEVSGPGPQVGRAAEPVLQTGVSFLDHQRVEACAGHHGEMLAVGRGRVEPPAVTLEPDPHRLLDGLRDGQVVREEVPRTRRQDGQDRVGAGEHVYAALHHAVPTPYEDKLRPEVEGFTNAVGGLLALGDLEPVDIGETCIRQSPAQLGQPATHRLARMRHDGHRPRLGRRALSDIHDRKLAARGEPMHSSLPRGSHSGRVRQPSCGPGKCRPTAGTRLSQPTPATARADHAMA